MRRRSFIKRLCGVATAAVVGDKLIPEDAGANACIEELTCGTGFGLAPVKREGAALLYKPRMDLDDLNFGPGPIVHVPEAVSHPYPRDVDIGWESPNLDLLVSDKIIGDQEDGEV